MTSAIASRLGPNASRRLIILADIALAAGRLSLAQRQHRRTNLVEKAARDYQTVADVAVERLIVDAVREAFPDHAIMGEENVGNRDLGNAPTVLIDPIDGTTNYLWGIPHFAIVISIREGDDIVAGVVYDPNLDELFTAEARSGAFLNGMPIYVAQQTSPQHVLIGAGTPVPGQVKSVPEETYHAAFRRLMDVTSGVRRLGSAALSIAYVACGRLDGFFEDSLSPHDAAASSLLVQEAGGLVTRFDGEPVSTTAQGPYLAAGPGIHAWLLEGFKAS